MSKRNRRTRIVFPVFKEYAVTVIQARDIVATGRRLHEDLTDCEAVSLTWPGQVGAYIILGPDAAESIVAHEASHVVRWMLAFAGARNDDEIFAYHLDFLVGRIHKFLKRGKA